MNWQQLAASSPFQTAVAAREALERGDLPQAQTGIEELIDALSRSDKRALKSHLIRLMAHVIKWHEQPDRRTRGWRATIRNARREIAAIQEDTPSLNREVLLEMWDDAFESAKEEAEGEMNQEVACSALSWEQVFEKEHDL